MTPRAPGESITVQQSACKHRLTRCAACQERTRELLALGELLRETPHTPPPDLPAPPPPAPRGHTLMLDLLHRPGNDSRMARRIRKLIQQQPTPGGTST